MQILRKKKYGVITGPQLLDIYEEAKSGGYAIPAVNVTNTSYINATLEAAAKANAYVIIQMAYERSQFFIGNSIQKKNDYAAIQGAVAGAQYIHHAAEVYKVPVILHTDHCTRKNIGWIQGLIHIGEQKVKSTGKPLFSSHMLDLSQETLEKNLALSKDIFTQLAPLEMGLEIELGITGGVEGSMDHSQVDKSALYTEPSDVWEAYRTLTEISPVLTIAASFGNVHGVYRPGDVDLKPSILEASQQLATLKSGRKNPLNFVFHGGSGSTEEEIQESISYGVIKMNIDTDLQWAYWDGVRNYYESRKPFLQSQIGNPKGTELPNKKYYDSPVWLAKAEESYSRGLLKYFEQLNAIDSCK